GVQRISPFVASLLRAANSFGDVAPVAVTPDKLAPVPVVDTLPVSYYPATRLRLVDTAVAGTTCMAWSKGSTDKAAAAAVLSGQGGRGGGAARAGAAAPRRIRQQADPSGQGRPQRPRFR